MPFNGILITLLVMLQTYVYKFGLTCNMCVIWLDRWAQKMDRSQFVLFIVQHGTNTKTKTALPTLEFSYSYHIRNQWSGL